MSAPRNTTHRETQKQPKKKRSLKRTHVADASLHEQGIVVDMSKSELDGIFSGLSLGEIENPQEALGRVYAMAIDSVAKTLLDGLSSLCDQAVEGDHEVVSTDHPLGAWIMQMIPRDPAKIAAFKDKLSVQIEAMKSRIQSSMLEGMAANSDLERMAAMGRQTGDMVRRTLSDAANSEVRLPGLGRRISDARLEEIYRLIQYPVPSDGIERFQITALPGAYRFHVGVPKTAQADETASQERLEAKQVQNIAQDVPPKSSESVPEIAVLESFGKETASDVVQAVSEVTGMLQNMALGMAHAVVETYQQEQAFLPLSETLKSDPRLDDDLSAFIDALEGQDVSEIDEDAITNDELAGALDMILAGLDLED